MSHMPRLGFRMFAPEGEDLRTKSPGFDVTDSVCEDELFQETQKEEAASVELLAVLNSMRSKLCLLDR